MQCGVVLCLFVRWGVWVDIGLEYPCPACIFGLKVCSIHHLSNLGMDTRVSTLMAMDVKDRPCVLSIVMYSLWSGKERRGTFNCCLESVMIVVGLVLAARVLSLSLSSSVCTGVYVVVVMLVSASSKEERCVAVSILLLGVLEWATFVKGNMDVGICRICGVRYFADVV
eukprot:6221640-Ditylum_brightwellii.AAC.1